MYAPVVARFLGWKPVVSDETSEYCAAVRRHPLVAEWYDDAAAEPEDWLVDDYEKTD
jgi:glutathione S-transferase